MNEQHLTDLAALLVRPSPQLPAVVERKPMVDLASDVQLGGIKKTTPPGYTYSRRHRGEWQTPEYDFRVLGIAQQTDGIILRTIKKKVDRILVAGYEFVGEQEDPVAYVRNRIHQMEIVSGRPFALLLRETFEDLARQANSLWVKVRSIESSSGEKRLDLRSNKEVEPVAAYYIQPFETLEFKTKISGELKKIRQVSRDTGEVREWVPEDVIHFYADRKPGYLVGTPDLLPALDDIALLRRIEDNVEELIESNLFPVYHYQVGTDIMPERRTPEGISESELVKRKIEYMPAGSVYVSDHRHQITALGSEGKALTIDNYLAYFKQRAISSAGATEVDLGMSGASNRSTANTLSKAMSLDIEALQTTMKIFLEHYVIHEILLEGGYDPFDVEDRVEIRFGVIDREERIALENQQIQMFQGNVRNLDEVRAALGDKPIDDEWLERSFFKMFEEPLSLAKSVGTPGSSASETLANVESSNLTPEAVNKEKQFAKQQAAAAAKAKAKTGAPSSSKRPSSAARTARAKSRPSNQRGTRSAPKTNRDSSNYLNLQVDDSTASVLLTELVDQDTLDLWVDLITQRYHAIKPMGVSLQTVAENLLHRLVKQ